MTMTPEQMIERVAALRHRGCDRCEDCRALVQVVALAREALAMKAARHNVQRTAARQFAIVRSLSEALHAAYPPLYIAPGIAEKFRLRDVPDTLGDPLE